MFLEQLFYRTLAVIVSGNKAIRKSLEICMILINPAAAQPFLVNEFKVKHRTYPFTTFFSLSLSTLILALSDFVRTASLYGAISQ